MASNRRAKTMTAEDVRADACERLRKVGAANVGPKEREHFGMAGHGWRCQWTDGHAAIFVPDDGPVRKALPEAWGAALQLDDRPALQWRPYTGISRAVHVLQAFARGLRTEHARIQLEPSTLPAHDSGRVVLHYADSASTATARTWADALVYAVPEATTEERDDVIAAAAANVAIKYLAALLWADSAEWTIRNVQIGKVPALAFVAPEVRVLVAEVRA
jgi:hypothetical protein